MFIVQVFTGYLHILQQGALIVIHNFIGVFVTLICLQLVDSGSNLDTMYCLLVEELIITQTLKKCCILVAQTEVQQTQVL